MENKICCGIYDFDGVLLPGEELMDKYVIKICEKASNAYCDKLFARQSELIKVQQRMEQERDVFGPEMRAVQRELEELRKKIEEHFMLKDQVLEETEEKYKNKIPYKDIYIRNNVYQGILELLWKIYDSKLYSELIVNTHVNAGTEIVAKRELLEKDFPPMKFVPILYHIEPYRDPYGGSINKNRKPSDKIGRLVNSIAPYIDVNKSTFVDNTASIIKRGRELGINCYFVDKNFDQYIKENPVLDPIPSQVIIEAANDTIDRVHGGKIKKLSL